MAVYWEQCLYVLDEEEEPAVLWAIILFFLSQERQDLNMKTGWIEIY